MGDAFEDRDLDGCQDANETSVRLADTDGGGRSDADEQLQDRTDPLLGNDDFGADPDADGLLNEDELAAGTDRLNPDTDGDALSDGREVYEAGSDPLNPDSDNGGAPDGLEVAKHGSNPLDPSDDYVGHLKGELSGGCHCATQDFNAWLGLVLLVFLRRRRRCA